jgi:hypothetical protein
MSVRPEAEAPVVEAPAVGDQTMLGVAIRESAHAVLTARGASELGVGELTATVLATLVGDLSAEDVDTLKKLAPDICGDVFAGVTTCARDEPVDCIDDGRVSMKLPEEAGEKLAATAAAPTALPKTESVVEKVMEKTTDGACMLLVKPAEDDVEKADAEPVENAVEAPAAAEAEAEAPVAPMAVPTSAPAVVESAVDIADAAATDAPAAVPTNATDTVVDGIDVKTPEEHTDAVAVDCTDAVVQPCDSASQLASNASTTVDAKLDTLLDCIVLAHEKMNARLDSLSEVLLKTTGTPMSDKFDRDTVLFFQNMYAPNKDQTAKCAIDTHTKIDMATLVQNARARHGL